MKRLLLVTAFATALLSAGLAPGTPPAAAGDMCLGGVQVHAGPMYYPPFGPSASGGVMINFIVGACLSGAGSVSGTFTANAIGNYCGHSTGQVNVGGVTLYWVGVGSVWVFTGPIGYGVMGGPVDAGCLSGSTSLRTVALFVSA